MGKFSRRDFIKTISILGAGISFLKPISAKAKKSGEMVRGAISEEVRWVPSICNFCSTSCSILVGVKKIDGVDKIVKIKGNPNSDLNRGKICARGQTGMLQTYDPNRIKTPLIRIKGSKRGEWKFRKATWSEAIDHIKTTIEKEDIKPWEWAPVCSWISCVFYKPFSFSFFAANQIPNIIIAPIQHCVTTGHMGVNGVTGLWNVHDQMLIDWENIKFGIFSTTNAGISGISTSRAVRLQKAIKNGAEIVVLDPRQSETASKGRWVPIKPGTDLAFFLALANYLIQNNYYDENFCSSYTNLPFLAYEKNGIIHPVVEMKEVKKGDKVVKKVAKTFFVFDKKSGKVSPIKGFTNSNLKSINKDSIDPKLDNLKDLHNYDITKEFKVAIPKGAKLSTIFTLVKKQLQNYSLDWCSEITDISKENLKDIFYKMGTIKPATIDCGWAGGRYRNMVQTRKVQAFIQAIIGGIDQKGGWIISGESRHKMEILLKYKKDVKLNGFRKPKYYEKFGVMRWLGHAKVWGNPKRYPHGYPAFSYVKKKMDKKAKKLNPIRPMFTDYGFYEGVTGKLKWKGKPYKLRLVYLNGSNFFRNFYPEKNMKEALTHNDMKLVIASEILPTDSGLYCDVILPDSTYLERDEPVILGNGPSHDLAMATRFKAIDPLYEAKGIPDVLYLMAKSFNSEKKYIKILSSYLNIDQEEVKTILQHFEKSGTYTPFADAIQYIITNNKAKEHNMDREHFLKHFFDKGIIIEEKKEDLLKTKNMPRNIPMATPSGRVEPYPLTFYKVSKKGGFDPGWDPNFIYFTPSFTRDGDKRVEIKHPKLKDGEFYFIYGKIGVVSHAGSTSANPILSSLIKQDQKSFKKIWIPKERGKQLGISNGDKIKIINRDYPDYYEFGEAYLTDLIRYDTIFMNSALGAINPKSDKNYKNGPAMGKLIPNLHDSATTAYRSQEFIVVIKKV